MPESNGSRAIADGGDTDSAGMPIHDNFRGHVVAFSNEKLMARALLSLGSPEAATCPHSGKLK